MKAQVVEVFGQKRLLKWSVPGVAHFITFWAFVILFATIVEAVGAGAEAPLADNASAAGRARNRRVEIAVSYK